MGFYELAVLGGCSSDERTRLRATIRELVDDFDLELDADVVVHDADSVSHRDKRVAFAAVYFGGDDYPDVGAIKPLIDANAPVIPFVPPGGDFATQVPSCLSFANGIHGRADDPEMAELATALLECVGLLRRQRRVFVSYRRAEARVSALQLYDVLSSRGFDVFLDTHAIRPGDPFEDVIWHRLADSDVMVMLDTSGYFERKWTRQEVARARAKEIQVLRVVWPGHTPSKLTDLAETLYLEPHDLAGPDGPLSESIADSIALRVETLRSRSIAARYMSICGKLRADVEKIGATIETIGAHRAIAVRLLDDVRIWAYPVVGIPTAETLYDVAAKAMRANCEGVPVVVYDHLGIRDTWSAHLEWLAKHIRAVRSIKVSEAGWTLAAWES